MKVLKKNISFADTNYFSAIANDYIAQDRKIEQFITAFPSVEAIRRQMQLKQKGLGSEYKPADRKILHQVLHQQYSGIALHEAVKSNIDALLSDKTFTICTAHQPNIFTGPLYFIYKISHAIKLAEACKIHFRDIHFVPVYYMGSEDNDLMEIGTFFLGDRKMKWDTTQTGACGRMNTNDLQSVTKEVLSVLNENVADEKWLSELIQQAYMSGLSLANACRIMVNGLFEKWGLVILDADHRQLKEVFIPVMEDELLHQRSSKLVHETTAEMSAYYKVQANGRDINLFYLKENIRERIEKKEDRWEVNQTDISFSVDELKAELYQYPERFSPNVILRPLYQEMLLPNIAFIGGGGELAYWLELKKVFDFYQLTYPLIFLRNSFLWIDKKTSLLIEKLKLKDTDIFLANEILYKKILADNESMLALQEKLQTLEVVYNDIENLSSDISINLLNSMKAHHAKANRIAHRITQKYRAHLKRNESDKIQLVDKMKSELFPSGSLQERHDNLIPYFKKYGKPFFDLLIHNQSGLESEFVLLTDE